MDLTDYSLPKVGVMDFVIEVIKITSFTIGSLFIQSLNLCLNFIKNRFYFVLLIEV